MNYKFYILIVCGLFILVYTLLSLRNDRNDRQPQMLQAEIVKNSFLMMGQFNYNLTSNNISTWMDSWSKVIETKDIIMAVPYCASHDYPKTHSSNYLCYESDYGYYSPYMNIAKVLKIRDISEILYVHDDMLISSY